METIIEQDETQSGIGYGGLGSRRYIENRYGEDTPIALRRQGIFRENPYQAYYWTLVDPGVLVYTDVTPYNNTIAAPMSELYCAPSWPAIVAPSLSSVYAKLEENWKNSRFYAGVTIGEGRESVRMIQDRLLSLKNAGKAILKRNLGEALRHLAKVPRNSRRRASQKLDDGDLSGSWLEIFYGWAPLYSDIYEASALVRLEPRTGTVRSSNVNKGDIIFDPYFNGKKIPSLHERRLHIKVQVQRAPNMLERMGLTDPLSTAWDLLPFSFVIDWFLPIGTYLRGLHAVGTIPVSKVCMTEVYRRKAAAQINNGGPAFQSTLGWNWKTLYGGRYIYDHTNMNRTVLNALPSPLSLIANLPQEVRPKWDPDLLQVANSVALTHAVFRRF